MKLLGKFVSIIKSGSKWRLKRFINKNLSLEKDGKNILHLFFEIIVSQEIDREICDFGTKILLENKEKIDWHKVSDNGRKPIDAILGTLWRMPVEFLEFYSRKDLEGNRSQEDYFDDLDEDSSPQDDLSFYREKVTGTNHKELLKFCLKQINKGEFSRPTFLSGLMLLEEEISIYLTKLDESFASFDQYVLSLTGRKTDEFKDFIIDYQVREEKRMDWFFNRAIRSICSTISSDEECLLFLKAYFKKGTHLGTFDLLSEYEMPCLTDFIQQSSLEKITRLISNAPDLKIVNKIFRSYVALLQTGTRVSLKNYTTLTEYGDDVMLLTSRRY